MTNIIPFEPLSGPTQRVISQLGSLGTRLAEDVALLSAKMDRKELKGSEIKLLRAAIYMIHSDRPLIGDFAAGVAIISTLASEYR